MKKIVLFAILVAFTALSFLICGCGTESNREANHEQTIVSVGHADYFGLNELTLGELANSADLIALGTVTRTIEIVPHETLKGVWQTKSAFQVEKSLKGDYGEEIIIIQTGAAGKDDGPEFKNGEQCFLFLSKGVDDLYRAVDRYGRFRIVEGRVSSVTPVQTGGETPPAYDLQFNNTALGVFISKVIDAIKADHPIPDEVPVISLELWNTMGGSIHDIFIYQDGTIVNMNEWGLRMPILNRNAKRSWSFGKISSENVSEFFDYFDSIGFDALDPDSFTFTPNSSGVMSDLQIKVTVNNGKIDNFLATSGYAPPEKDTAAKKLPPPLDEIYTKLITLADYETKEAWREDIPAGGDISIEYPE